MPYAPVKGQTPTAAPFVLFINDHSCASLWHPNNNIPRKKTGLGPKILKVVAEYCWSSVLLLVNICQGWKRHLSTVLGAQTFPSPEQPYAFIKRILLLTLSSFAAVLFAWVFTYKSSWVWRISLPRCLTCTCSTEWNHFCCSLVFMRSARSSITATRQSRRTQCSSTRRFILPADVETWNMSWWQTRDQLQPCQVLQPKTGLVELKKAKQIYSSCSSMRGFWSSFPIVLGDEANELLYSKQTSTKYWEPSTRN